MPSLVPTGTCVPAIMLCIVDTVLPAVFERMPAE
jgi:hypothetical protein